VTYNASAEQQPCSEAIKEQKKGTSNHIRDRCALAKAEGFGTKALRTVIRSLAMERGARKEQEALIATDEEALGA
jgi:uncharacterized protein (UPF0335 family)